jgi:hypothetical protein
MGTLFRLAVQKPMRDSACKNKKIKRSFALVTIINLFLEGKYSEV